MMSPDEEDRYIEEVDICEEILRDIENIRRNMLLLDGVDESDAKFFLDDLKDMIDGIQYEARTALKEEWDAMLESDRKYIQTAGVI